MLSILKCIKGVNMKERDNYLILVELELIIFKNKEK